MDILKKSKKRVEREVKEKFSDDFNKAFKTALKSGELDQSAFLREAAVVEKKIEAPEPSEEANKINAAIDAEKAAIEKKIIEVANERDEEINILQNNIVALERLRPDK